MLKALILIAIALLGSLPLWASDEFPTPVAIVQPILSPSQDETDQNLNISSLDLRAPSLPEDVEIQIDPSFYESQVPKTSDPKKTRYFRMLEWLRKSVPIKMEKFFSKVKVPQEIQNEIINGISVNLENASSTVASANASGYSFGGLAYTGLGLNEVMGESIRRQWWGKLLPRREGFGLVLSTGIAYVTFQKDGRQKMIFRLYAEAGMVDKMINWMLVAFAGGTGGKVAESLSPEIIESMQKVGVTKRLIKRAHLGPLGAINSSEDYFEHIMGAGFELPLFLGSFSFYEFNVHRVEVNILFDIEGIRWLKQKTVNSCKWVVGRLPKKSSQKLNN